MIDIDELNALFCSFNNVVSFQVTFDNDLSLYKMNIELSEDIFERWGRWLKIQFIDISILNIRDFGDKFAQFVSLVIEKRTDSWDSANYNLLQVEDEDISFSFNKFNAEIVIPT